MRGVFGAAMSAMAPAGQMLVNLGRVHREGTVVRYWDDWLTWMPRQGWVISSFVYTIVCDIRVDSEWRDVRDEARY